MNNVPPKSCTYSCLYCQLGPTTTKEVEPREMYTPEAIRAEVAQRLADARAADTAIDYVTFVPDGEPTLDARLGDTIELLRPLGVRIAVISNGSLLWRADVRRGVVRADWVSVKVDTVKSATWRRINRPHPSLELETVLDGIVQFAREFRGTLATETMLLRQINTIPDEVSAVADFLAGLRPAVAYLAAPTRPTTDPGARLPTEDEMHEAFELFARRLDRVEFLIEYEGDAFAPTGDPARDLLSILAVHPMRESAVREFLRRAHADWAVLDALLAQGQVTERWYEGHRYFLRRMPIPSERA